MKKNSVQSVVMDAGERKKNVCSTAADHTNTDNSYRKDTTPAFYAQQRISAAQKFFNLLYGNIPAEPAKFGYLWTKKGEELKTYPFDISNVEERAKMARKAIELSDDGADVYYGVNLMDTAPAADARAKADQVTMQTAVVTDIDIEGGNHTSSEQKKYPPNFDVAKSFLPFEPSILINSGYGLHALNIFNPPISITADNRQSCVERNKKFLKVIRSRAGIYQKAVDAVHDLPRVLRVPGTYNYKMGRDNAPLCHIVEVNDIRFTPADMDAKLNALIVDKTPTTKSARTDYVNDNPDLKEYRIRRMLDYINVVDGEYDKWLDVGFALFNEGMDCNLWEKWSRSQPEFKEGEIETKWKSFRHEPNGITIATLYQFAVEGGYDEKQVQREYYQMHPKNLQNRGDAFLNALTEKNIADARADFETESDDKIFNEQIAIWRSTYDNAPINPAVLTELKAARDFISNLTVDTFKTSYAVDIAIRRKVALCKFYIPDIAQEFFSVMKKAQQAAMLKIKDLKAQKPPVVIPDELVTLADMARSKTESDVDEIVTRIKADQKDYKLKVTNEEIERQTKAQEKAYEENPPSTKQAFADCPIDLILPNGVYLDAREGIRRVDWDKPVGRYGRPVISICTTPIVPTKIFREPTKHVTQYEIAIRTGNIWRYVICDGRTLIDPRKVAELADYGALIKNPAHLAKYFAEIIGLPKNKGRIPEIKCYQKPGWRGDKFIYPSGGTDYICRRSNIDYEKIFATKGNPDAWKKKFVEATCKSPIHRIFVGAAAASTFLETTGEPNFWLHIFGKKNSSKTPLLKLALSIFGNPNELMRTFDSSAKNMVAMAVGLNCLPQGIDELESLGKKGEEELQKAIYDLHAGKDRQKNTRSGDVRQMETFHTVRLTTGEKPLHKPTDKGGAYKRAIDLYISDYLFDIAEGRDLHLFLARNHGHYGRAWTEYNEKFKDEIIADFDATSKELFATFGTTFEPAHITAFAASTVGFWHLRKCMELEEKFDSYHALADARMTLRLLPTAEEISDTKRGVDLLSSWIDSHPKNFIVENDSGDFISALSFGETSGIKFADGRVAFFPQAFRRICEQELQLASYEKLLNELFDEEKLICPSRREKRKSVKLSGTVKKMYMFKAGVLIFPASNDGLIEV